MPTLKRTKFLSASILLLSAGATAYGQVPPSNDTSDANANTGMGTGTLQSNTTGVENTATGVNALALNTSGIENTATGVNALLNNTTANGNTAFGYASLLNNTTGSQNTASGFVALLSNTTGSQNTATGVSALSGNTTGVNNTASGIAALASNTTGFTNSAVGGAALSNNTTGSQNTAIGGAALLSNTTGNNNIALGFNAGSNLKTGGDDIDIGSWGMAAENGTIRIGDPKTQHAAYIAGIWGHVVRPGLPVFVGPDGVLGVVASSERYKTDIAPMGSATAKISQLRPVTFRLKTDAGQLQYGLIAEEVDQVFPELVVRDQAGTIEGVRYDELAPMLLNEVQQQRQQLTTQAEQLAALRQQFAELQELDRETRMALMKLQVKDTQVVMR